TLQKMDEKSLVIIISQHRYAKETLQMAEWLQGQNVDMLGITDSNVAPLHEFVPFTFVLEQVEQSTIDLMPLLTIFLNALVSGMTTYDPAYYEARKINFDKIEQQFILNKWSCKKMEQSLDTFLQPIFIHLHTHPEISWEEKETTNYLVKTLKEIGLQPILF